MASSSYSEPIRARELSDFPLTAKLRAHSEFALIERLMQQIDSALAPLLRDYSSSVLFDFPDYNNVGDNAIFLGELNYLRLRHTGDPVYITRADQCDMDRVASRYKDAAILINGGGNFGDLWPWHQVRREALLEKFPGRRIIQLPQTIQYNSRDALKRTSEVIKRHGNFVMMVRDTRSYELAVKEFGCTVVACPDMAIWMGPQERPRLPSHELLLLLRNDQERAPGVESAVDVSSGTSIVRDWDMGSRPVRAARKLLALAATLAKPERAITGPDELRNQYFKTLAKTRVANGLSLLSLGQYIITDRLHAYLLALLLDIPRTVIDNSYGKLSGFIDTWMPEEAAGTLAKRASVSDAVTAWQTRVSRDENGASSTIAR